jgi:hypothetical protein
VKILEQRLLHRTSGTSTYSHTYGDYDDSQNPVSSRDAEVDGFGHRFGNSTTRRRVAMVIPISYAALRETMRERERQRAAAMARPMHQEVVEGGHGGGLVRCVVHLSSWAHTHAQAQTVFAPSQPQIYGLICSRALRNRRLSPGKRRGIGTDSRTVVSFGGACSPCIKVFNHQ